jgi:hypothetical protein
MSADLAQDCANLAAAANESVSWLERNREEVGTNYAFCRREFRYSAMQARQLEKAARLPMAVGVFGPSQVGKSYLVSALARKGTEPLFTLLGDKTVDFLKEMNPDEDQEATGLVTRFTLRPSTAPKSHPLTVRLLGQIDLIKILANTFFLDFDPAKEVPPDDKAVVAALNAAEAVVGARREPVDTLTEVDIDELGRYFEDQFKARQTYRVLKETQYWPRLEELAPRLPLGERVKLYSFLWGGIEQFSQLYVTLYGALAQLGFAETAYCPLEAVIPKDRSIIAVSALKGIDSTSTDTIEVISDNGKRGVMTRAQIAAIVAELVITIRDQPWDYFKHTDLLDFPGARSRDINEDAAQYVKRPGAIAYLLRRGKVAYLFDRYCAQMELTSMMLCLTPGNQEVRTLAGLVGSWIRTFQGDSPAERAERLTALFVVLTKFDRRFEEAKGRAEDSTDRWVSAISTTLTGFFGTGRDNWVAEWTPRQPFNNLFWMRNPYWISPGLMKYDAQKQETGLLDPQRIAKIKEEYLTTKEIQRHVGNAEQAWEAALKLNDGGISYLASALEPVCRPELKLTQLRKRLVVIQKHLHDLIAEYRVSGNVEEEAVKRRQAAQVACEGLSSAIEGQRFMHLIKELQPSGSDVLHAFRRRIVGQGKEPMVVAGRRPSASKILSSVFGNKPAAGGDKPAAAPKDHIEQLASVAMEQWTSSIQRLAQQKSLLDFLDVPGESVEVIARELIAAGERADLGKNVATAMKETTPVLDGGSATLFKISLAAVEVINQFVYKLGEDRRPVEQRAKVDGKPVFGERPRIDSLTTLPELGAEYAEKHIAEWLSSFVEVAESNARGPVKRRFSAVESAALEAIIVRLVEA